MAITDPRAIRFVNEEVRPLTEAMRALKARADAALVKWYGEISALTPNDIDAVDDGREAEGISRLTGADVNKLVVQLAAYQTQLDETGVIDVISKSCVRGLDVNIGI
jgi:hypothetical protein